MQKLFLVVVLVGALVGFMLPSGPAAEATKAPAAASAPAHGEESYETLLNREPDGHFYAQGQVNGESVRFLIDTGASGVALTREDAERLGIELDPEKLQVVGSGASGPVHGQIVELDSVSLDGKEARNLTGAVLEGLEVSLLGQSYLGQYAMEVRGDTMRLE